MESGAKVMQTSRARIGEWLTSREPDSAWEAWIAQCYFSFRVFSRNRLALAGLIMVTALMIVAVFAPILATSTADTQDLLHRLEAPSAAHWFGTDEFGRDIYSRIVFGARYTLQFVGLVILVIAPIGLCVGMTAGYAGGVVDTILMRITDIFLAFPRLILALAFVATMGPGLRNAMIAIAITAWPSYARVARAEALRIRNSDYIAAIRLLGGSPWRIIFRHVLPLCIPTIIVRASLDMGGIILTAASLGFLGLGAQPPLPEWGAMISSGRQFFLDQWWVATLPGFAICIATVGFNLLGDGLRDVLDPKYR